MEAHDPEPTVRTVREIGKNKLNAYFARGYGMKSHSALPVWTLAIGLAGITGLSFFWWFEIHDIAAIVGIAVLDLLMVMGWVCEIQAKNVKNPSLLLTLSNISHSFRIITGVLALILAAVFIKSLYFGYMNPSISSFIDIACTASLVTYGFAGHVRMNYFRSVLLSLKNAINYKINIGLAVTCVMASLLLNYFWKIHRVDKERLFEDLNSAITGISLYYQSHKQLPEERHTEKVFHGRDLAIVAPGVVRISARLGEHLNTHLYLIARQDPLYRDGLSYRCVHDHLELESVEIQTRRVVCERDAGFQLLRLANPPSQIEPSSTGNLVISGNEGGKPCTYEDFKINRYFLSGHSNPSGMTVNPDGKIVDANTDRSFLRDTFAESPASQHGLFEVIGFADASGQKQLNQKLSESRAANTKKLLIELGIPESSISIRGAGAESTPAGCSGKNRNELNDCLSRSRRVEIRVRQKSGEPPFQKQSELSQPKSGRLVETPSSEYKTMPLENKSLLVSRQPGDVFRDTLKISGFGPEMVVLPQGRYLMGAAPGEPNADRFREEPQQAISIHYNLAVSKYEITFDDWDRCHDAAVCPNVREDWSRGRMPVNKVSWQDITGKYLKWLNREAGLSENSPYRYRLLRESEWEYAARGVTTETAPQFPFAPLTTSNRMFALLTGQSWSSDGKCLHTRLANYNGKYDDYANCGAKTGKYLEGTWEAGNGGQNPFGLYDMHGNLSEWVEDCWKDTAHGNTEWMSGECNRHVVRGGSWASAPGEIRSAHRIGSPKTFRSNTYGFRIARTLP